MSNLEVLKINVTNGKAIPSLILGILSILSLIIIPFLGILLGITGLTLGIIGLKEIKHFNQEGKKIAVSGVICSSLGILLPILFAILAFIFFMNITVS